MPPSLNFPQLDFVEPSTGFHPVTWERVIEHFSKWVKLIVLLDKSHKTNHVFLQQVLNRFGACVECLINQGSEFRGKFQDLLDHAFIDHHQTSRDHPQANGLVKKMVKTCKKGL
jgi:hypothetical protein